MGSLILHGGAQRVQVPVEGRGGPVAPPGGEPCRQPLNVVLVIELGDLEAGAGAARIPRQARRVER